MDYFENNNNKPKEESTKISFLPFEMRNDGRKEFKFHENEMDEKYYYYDTVTYMLRAWKETSLLWMENIEIMHIEEYLNKHLLKQIPLSWKNDSKKLFMNFKVAKKYINLMNLSLDLLTQGICLIPSGSMIYRAFPKDLDFKLVPFCHNWEKKVDDTLKDHGMELYRGYTAKNMEPYERVFTSSTVISGEVYPIDICLKKMGNQLMVSTKLDLFNAILVRKNFIDPDQYYYRNSLRNNKLFSNDIKYMNKFQSVYLNLFLRLEKSDKAKFLYMIICSLEKEFTVWLNNISLNNTWEGEDSTLDFSHLPYIDNKFPKKYKDFKVLAGTHSTMLIRALDLTNLSVNKWKYCHVHLDIPCPFKTGPYMNMGRFPTHDGCTKIAYYISTRCMGLEDKLLSFYVLMVSMDYQVLIKDMDHAWELAMKSSSYILNLRSHNIFNESLFDRARFKLASQNDEEFNKNMKFLNINKEELDKIFMSFSFVNNGSHVFSKMVKEVF